MVRCARSSTSLVWGIPVHPTHLLRAIKTHELLLPVLRALRGCHLFAPDPAPYLISHYPASSSPVKMPSTSLTTAVTPTPGPSLIGSFNLPTLFSFTPAGSPPYPFLFNTSTYLTLGGQNFGPVVARTEGLASRRKGIASLPVEILELIEAEILLSAHEEDVPRSLVGALEKAGFTGDDEGGMPGWKRICLCGERYVETSDVVRCRERVLTEMRSDETRKYLLKHFGLMTAIVSTPLKHSIVLLVLPHKVSTLPAPLPTMPSLPMHPPIPDKLLSTFPCDAPTIIAGRQPLSKSFLHKSSVLPSSVVPLVTPSDDFIGHLHPGMFARNHWRLRNQNSGIRASVIDPSYLLLTEEKFRRFRWCVEELVLWKGVRLAREELGYEELDTIEHHEMALSGKAGISIMESLEVDGNLWGLKTQRGEEGSENEGRGKRAKVDEHPGPEVMLEREKKYWKVAIKPELWLLEELSYEP